MIGRLGYSRSWVEVCILASSGAAAIHLAAARPHFTEWPPAGVFMLACGLAQLAWAARLAAAPADAAICFGVALNAGVVTLWLISRTAGLPFGPEPGTPEDVLAADALATALEAAAILAGIAALRGVRSPNRFVVAVVGAAAAAAVLTGAHDRGREGLTAAAALVSGFVACSLLISFEKRRGHDEAPRAHGLVAVAAPRRADLAAGRGIARPRGHRHLEQPGV